MNTHDRGMQALVGADVPTETNVSEGIALSVGTLLLASFGGFMFGNARNHKIAVVAGALGVTVSLASGAYIYQRDKKIWDSTLLLASMSTGLGLGIIARNLGKRSQR